VKNQKSELCNVPSRDGSRGVFMKTVTGWRRIDNEMGFVNETTGQNLVVTKKQFGEHYVVMVFAGVEGEEEGIRISPEFPTEAKADAFAMAWLSKHPEGAT
jgi:hypothetical protein